MDRIKAIGMRSRAISGPRLGTDNGQQHVSATPRPTEVDALEDAKECL